MKNNIDPEVEAAYLATSNDESLTDAQLSGVVAKTTGVSDPVLVRIGTSEWDALVIAHATAGVYADIASPRQAVTYVALPHVWDSQQRATTVWRGLTRQMCARTVAEGRPLCDLHPWSPQDALEDARREGRLVKMLPPSPARTDARWLFNRQTQV